MEPRYAALFFEDDRIPKDIVNRFTIKQGNAIIAAIARESKLWTILV